MSGGEVFAVDGPAGALEARLHSPTVTPTFRAVVSHPHPLYGGTMENAVVMLATRALVAAGGEVVRFNFRGVSRSAGEHDGGEERRDLLAVVTALRARRPALPLTFAGYSFGAVMTLDLLSGTEQPGDGDGSSAEPEGTEPAGALLIAPPVTHYESRSWRLGRIPAAVVYGDRDALTPAALLSRQTEAWGPDVRLYAIPGAGHDLGAFTAPRALEAALHDAVAGLMAGGAAQDLTTPA